MNIFELDIQPQKDGERLCLGEHVVPIEYKNIEKHDRIKEKDLEDLIEKNPQLLNYDSESDEQDLLIVSRQMQSTSNKRSDLLAIDSDGFLVTIEIKRDAIDEKNRSESFEFQAIRYAANHRTMDLNKIINAYATYLKNSNNQSSGDYQTEAIKGIYKHLFGEFSASEYENSPSGKDISSLNLVAMKAKLEKKIDPTEKQKIYLVAADFADDCLSACAWLREHQIEIYCFKLQPYRFGEKFYLNQERLIPPPALDEFYVGTKEGKEAAQKSGITRAASIRLGKIEINTSTFVVHSWKNLWETCIRYLLENGTSPKDLYHSQILYPDPDVIVRNGQARSFLLSYTDPRDQKKKTANLYKNLGAKSIFRLINKLAKDKNLTVKIYDELDNEIEASAFSDAE